MMLDDRLNRNRLEDLADADLTPVEPLGPDAIVVRVPATLAQRFATATLQQVDGDEDDTAAATIGDATDENGDPVTVRVLCLSRLTASALRVARPVAGYWVIG